jgi:hypothetical protein
MPCLPSELSATIVELVWLDSSEPLSNRKRNLSGYASACRQFASHVQPLLFQNLTLKTASCSTGLRDLLQARPAISKMINSIAINPGYNGTRDVFTCLWTGTMDRLTVLDDLTIGYLVLDDQRTDIIQTLSPSKLTLRSCEILSGAGFSRFLSWFPRLQELQLVGNTYSMQPLEFPPSEWSAHARSRTLSTPLKSLVLSGGRSLQPVLPWFLDSQIGCELENLTIHCTETRSKALELGKQLITHHGESLKRLTIFSPPCEQFWTPILRKTNTDTSSDMPTSAWSMAGCVNLTSMSIGQANTNYDLPRIVDQLRMLPQQNALRTIEITLTVYTQELDRRFLKNGAWPPALTDLDGIMASWESPGVQSICWTIQCGKAQQQAMLRDKDFAIVMPKAYARRVIRPIQFSMW